MRLFLSIEAQNATQNGLADILNDVRKSLHYLTCGDFVTEGSDKYGSEFQLISIIPTCMEEMYWESLGWKERVYISRKKKEAEVRLKMDYEQFINGDMYVKKILFVLSIVRSLQAVQKKAKGDFKGDRLIQDILDMLNITQNELEKIENYLVK